MVKHTQNPYPEPFQTFKMDYFAKIVNSLPLIIFAKWSILIVWQGPEYASGLKHNVIFQVFCGVNLAN